MVRSPLSKHSLIPSALACVALLSLQACPDPAGQYDDFEGRAEGFKNEGPIVLADAEVPDAVVEGCPVDLDACVLDGDYLLTLATQIDPSKPIQLRLTVGHDARTVDWSLIPVRQQCDGTLCSTDDPTYREDLPDSVIDPDPVEVDDEGNFTIEFGRVTVPGDANAISGSPIVAELTLTGKVLGDRAICGNFYGMLFEPFEFTLTEPDNNFGVVYLPEDADIGGVTAVGRCP